jgi:predicted peroxiredoxin
MTLHAHHEIEIEVPHWFQIDAEIRDLASGRREAGAAATRETTRGYVVMLTAGLEDGGKRATLAFSAACAALAMDLDTILFMVGDGSHWAYEGAVEGVREPGFPPLENLMDSFVELGGRLCVCAACDQVCSVAGADGMVRARRREIQPTGLATVLAHMVGGNSVTF